MRGMQFIRIDTDSLDDIKVQTMIEKLGFYYWGVWSALLLEIGKQEKHHYIIFANEIWIKNFATKVKLSKNKLQNFLKTISEIGLINRDFYQHQFIIIFNFFQINREYFRNLTEIYQKMFSFLKNFKKVDEEKLYFSRDFLFNARTFLAIEKEKEKEKELILSTIVGLFKNNPESEIENPNPSIQKKKRKSLTDDFKEMNFGKETWQYQSAKMLERIYEAQGKISFNTQETSRILERLAIRNNGSTPEDIKSNILFLIYQLQNEKRNWIFDKIDSDHSFYQYFNKLTQEKEKSGFADLRKQPDFDKIQSGSII